MSVFGRRLRYAGLGGFGSRGLNNWLARSPIRSMQAGTATIANGSTTGTGTLSAAVVVANTVIFYLGSTYDNPTDANSSRYNAYLQLTNATSIVGTRITNVQQVVVSFIALEFQSGVLRTNQAGTIVVAGGAVSNTATIATAVNTNRAFPVSLGLSTSSADGFGADTLGAFALTNSTTVTLARLGAVSGITGSFQIIEFEP